MEGEKIGIAVALAKAQLEMGVAAKDKKNPHFKSSYADLASVMAACMDALGKNGIAVVQPFVVDEGKEFVDTILVHGESGSQLSCRIPVINKKGDMQGLGSAMTYARRYGLMAMAGVAPDDDDGNAASQGGNQQQRQQDAPKPTMHELEIARNSIDNAETLDALGEIWKGLPAHVRTLLVADKDRRKADLSAPAVDPIANDEIPY